MSSNESSYHYYQLFHNHMFDTLEPIGFVVGLIAIVKVLFRLIKPVFHFQHDLLKRYGGGVGCRHRWHRRNRIGLLRRAGQVGLQPLHHQQESGEAGEGEGGPAEPQPPNRGEDHQGGFRPFPPGRFLRAHLQGARPARCVSAGQQCGYIQSLCICLAQRR